MNKINPIRTEEKKTLVIRVSEVISTGTWLKLIKLKLIVSKLFTLLPSLLKNNNFFTRLIKNIIINDFAGLGN